MSASSATPRACSSHGHPRDRPRLPVLGHRARQRGGCDLLAKGPSSTTPRACDMRTLGGKSDFASSTLPSGQLVGNQSAHLGRPVLGRRLLRDRHGHVAHVHHPQRGDGRRRARQAAAAEANGRTPTAVLLLIYAYAIGAAKLKGASAADALACTTPPRVATIEIACEAPELAEWLTPELQKGAEKGADCRPRRPALCEQGFSLGTSAGAAARNVRADTARPTHGRHTIPSRSIPAPAWGREVSEGRQGCKGNGYLVGYTSRPPPRPPSREGPRSSCRRRGPRRPWPPCPIAFGAPAISLDGRRPHERHGPPAPDVVRHAEGPPAERVQLFHCGRGALPARHH